MTKENSDNIPYKRDIPTKAACVSKASQFAHNGHDLQIVIKIKLVQCNDIQPQNPNVSSFS